MILANVEAVRLACIAWGARDIDAIREIYTPDVVAHGGALWPEGSGEVRGAEEIISTFESIMSAFESSELIPESLIDGEDVLVVPLLWRGIFRGSEAPIEQRLIAAHRFRDGHIAFIGWYPDINEALEAVGLPHSAAETLVPFDSALANVPGGDRTRRS